MARLDENCLFQPTNASTAAFLLRWSLYTNACALAAAPVKPDDSVIGDQWKQFENLKRAADQFRSALTNYHGPYRQMLGAVFSAVARDAEAKLQMQYVDEYVKLVTARLQGVSQTARWEPVNLTNAAVLLASVGRDLEQEEIVRAHV